LARQRSERLSAPMKTASTSAHRARSNASIERIAHGRGQTHWRTGTSGNTSSTRRAAMSAIRRPRHEGQQPRRSHETPTTIACPQRLTLGRRDFYRHVCLALGLSPKATAAAVFYAICTPIADLGRESVHPVLLIDEAHLLHQDVLDHLHILANYEWDSKPLLSIVLVGLPELRQRLPLAKNRSLWSRIHTRISLGEATAGDAAEYIAYRLEQPPSARRS